LLFVFTFLNPHTYLDTLILIGSIGAKYTTIDDKFIFLSGCLFGSVSWFIVLGYGSRILIPLFQKKLTWQILDFLIAFIMFGLAYSFINDLVL
jgi:L-lysine exporter family protein LysE/ArgO